MWWCIHALLCVTMKLLLFYYSCMHAYAVTIIINYDDAKIKKTPKKK